MKTVQELREECKEKGVKFSIGDTALKLQTKINNHIMSKETKAGNITAEQIAAWKKEHGKVFTLKVNVTENDIAIGYLKSPNRNHKSIALSMYAQNKILETGEFLRDNCWLGGDERLKTNENIADSAAVQASGIVKFLDTELGEA